MKDNQKASDPYFLNFSVLNSEVKAIEVKFVLNQKRLFKEVQFVILIRMYTV